jgi:nucleoside 2-deoxyribosyltransferase
MSEEKRCPICDSGLNNYSIEALNDRDYIDCPVCGKFYFHNLAFHIEHLDDFKNYKSIVNYRLRNHQGSSKPVQLSADLVKAILKSTQLPKPLDQADKLLFHIGNSLTTPNENYREAMSVLCAVIGARDTANIVYVFNHLLEKDLVYGKVDHLKGMISCQMTMSGWQKFDELDRPRNFGKNAFMAMKYENKVLEKIYETNIINAVKETGFQINLLKDVLQAGSIDDQLRVQLRNAKFLIVDLTDDNNGAYWEAGYAEGLQKPVIYLCEKDKFAKFKTHFDTSHLTTVLWHEETIEEDMKNLKAVIRRTFPAEAIMED